MAVDRSQNMTNFNQPTNTQKRWTMNTRGIFSALLGAVFMLGASPGMALDPDPTFQIAAKNIQRVPTSFKFQAAISQAKMPVGEAVFQTLIVNIKKGDDPMCTETFTNVQVRDSVLNLDIGKQMSCDMDAVMAEHSGLTFQVCIGGPENCLKPVELGTVPYAVKSNFAVQAQEAHTSDVAVQSHYTHRVTADRDLFESQDETLGAGYFDFYTEDSGTLATSLQTLDAITLSDTHRTEDLSVVGYTPVGTDGYISWVPTAGDSLGHVLNICARDLNSDIPAMLDRLVFHSNLITLRGDQEVFGNSVTTGDVDVGGALEVFSNADFYDDVNVEENLHVKMESDLDLAVRANYTLTVTDHTQLNSTLTTEGATQLNSTLTAEGATQLNNTLTVAADQATTLGGTLTVADTKASTLGGTLLVKETSTLTGDVAALANATVAGTSTLTGDVSALSNMSVTGTSTLTGDVSALANATVSGTSTLSGAVTAETTLTVNGTSTLVDPVTAQNTLTVEGATNLNDNVNIAAGKTLTNAGHTQLNHTLTVASGKATTLGGSLTVAEGQSSTFNGDVSVGADDTLTVNGTTSLQGSLTALGQVTVGQDGQQATAMSIYHNVNFLGDVTIPSDSISYNFGDQQIVYSQNIVNGEVKEVDIEDNAITAAKIAANAVSSSEIAANAVSSSEIAANSVGNSEMLDNAIGNSEMLDNAIGSAEVIANSLTAADLAANSVDSSEIAAGAVGASELANDAVVGGTGGDIKDESITSADIDNGTIVNADISSNAAIAGSKIASLDASKLTGTISNTLTANWNADDLASGSVGASELANDAVVGGTGGDIKDESITSADIDNGTITADDLGANSVNYSEIATDAVRAAEIQAGAVGTSEVADNSLTASDLAANSVGSSEIAADAVGISELDIPRVRFSSYYSGGVYHGITDWLDADTNSENDRIARVRGDSNGGAFLTYNRDQDWRFYTYVNSDDNGQLEIRNSNNALMFNLWVSDGKKASVLDLYTQNYSETGVSSGADKRRAVQLSGFGNEGGYLALYDNSTSTDYNQQRVSLSVHDDDSFGSNMSGRLVLYDGHSSDSKHNIVWIGRDEYGSGAGTFGGGQILIYDKGGTAEAGIRTYSSGTLGEVWGDDKNFVVDHPIQKDKVIVYTSLEGSTADMYHRGTYRLENGYAEIPLPDHFYLLAEEEGMSATLTPRSIESKGLAILAIKPDRLVVQELSGGKGNYEFDYNVIATREGKVGRSNLREWVDYRFGHIGDGDLKAQISEARRNGVSTEEIVNMVREVELAAEPNPQPTADPMKGE